MRTGIGFETLRLDDSWCVSIGGVRISKNEDAEVDYTSDILVRAIVDSMLGAAALGDVATRFPRAREEWSCGSRAIISAARDMLSRRQIPIYNVDCVILAEIPGVQAVVGEIRELLAKSLMLPLERMNVKVSQHAGIGTIGRMKGIAAFAVTAVANGLDPGRRIEDATRVTRTKREAPDREKVGTNGRGEMLLEQAGISRTAELTDYSVGIGYDVHKLVEDRKLMIGGVNVMFSKGLDGHSDADVLLHAVIDAIFGASGLGDIGTRFPPDDPQWEGADSAEMLTIALKEAGAAGHYVEYVDSTVVAKEPYLQPWILKMRRRMAHLLGLSEKQVNVKARSHEEIGAFGRGEGIAALAVVTLRSNR